MLFNSWEFLVLLLATFALYHVPVPGIRRKTWQVSLLLVSSALFYAWNEPRLLILLSASCVLNAIAVERILFWKTTGTGGSVPEPGSLRAKRWLFWTVTLNLGFLAFFKYAGFLANVFPDTLIPGSWKFWLTDIPLPVGISFYTFQGISLVVDVWRNDISPNTTVRLAARGANRAASLRDTSFYIAFFPQLVAGPIVKAHEFVDQIGAKHFSDIDWITVRRGLITGYFLKIFVADNLSEQTVSLSTRGAELASSGPINLMSLLYGYSLQIFADFAGYSLIAIGLGALFGYKLPPNFNFPYLSTSVTEFWRRWHISLSSWLRDYLYFPLGGNRKGAGRTYFNLFLVMFLGGLWHGAAWKFALWGSLHGLFLALERLVTRRRHVAAVCDRRSENESLGAVKKDRRSEIVDGRSKTEGQTSSIHSSQSTIHDPSSVLSPLPSAFRIPLAALRWLVTFHIVTFLWLTFMMPDIDSIVAFFKGVCSGKTKFSGPPIFSLLFYGSAVVLYHAWGWLREHHEHFAHKLARSPVEAMIHSVMVFLVLTNPGAPQGFIYFQF